MFTTKEYISFSDCDPAGIMFFSRAFEKAHSCYEKFLFGSGLGYYFSSAKVIIPILHAESNFRKPLRAGDEVTVNLTLAEIRENSFSLIYNILDKQNEIAATVKIAHLCALKENIVKCNIPEDLKEELLKLKS